MQNPQGRKIRSYKLMEEIGEGGFGVVYRAFQDVIEREVVIKAILPIYANDPSFIRNFEAEAHLVARLEHPNIVPLYDYWRDPDGAYLVMRFVRGGSLLDTFRRGVLWDLETVARVLEQIAGALSVAHRNDVVHQDIKPANILLDEDNNAYLTDFGIAIDLANSVNLAAMGDEDVIHGSPAYIAPEQIKRETITKQADIYSLGLVLYEMLAGAHPFENLGLMELLKHQTDIELPPLQDFRKTLPEELNNVIWRATEKIPRARYDHVIDLAEDFRRVVNEVEFVPEAESDNNAQVTAFKPFGPRGAITSVINLDAGPPNPYKGLRPFQEGDSADFHGRDELVDSLMQRLGHETGNRFLAVVGPSGSGKSSVVRAGLLPAIRSSDDPQWENCFIIDMTPNTQPLKEIENALLKVAVQSDDNIANRLHTSTRGLLQSVDAILPGDGSELLLVIDQFEEVFTMTEDEDQRRAFLNNIYTATTDPLSRLRVVVTLRADFYDRPLLYSGIGDLIRNHTEVVLPLSQDELREAIVNPADRVGLTLESGLVERILDDVARQPGSLPLLQYTLTELYEKRDNLNLTLKSYDEMGGITGALAKRAEQLYERLTDEEQSATRQLFLRLVSIGDGTEDTRRRAKQAELNTLTGDREMMRGLIEEFGKFRLLSFDNDPTTRTPTVEVAHEALIRSWSRLREWINESRDELREQRKLATATQDWVNGDKLPNYLATGARLEQFETLLSTKTLALSDDERSFIQASVELRERNRRLWQAAVTGLVIITVLAVMFGVVALVQSIQAQDARDDAIVERDRADQESIISRSRELAASALVTIEQIDLPLLLSVEALETANTYEARNSLLTALQFQPQLQNFLHGATSVNRAVVYSPNGNSIAAGGQSDTIIVWDTNTRQSVFAPLAGHTDWVNALAYSPDGTILASGSEDTTIILWDVQTGQMIGTPIPAHDAEVWSLAFSPDGTILASGSADGTIKLWDVSSQTLLENPIEAHNDIVYSVIFNNAGDLLASGSADGIIKLWTLDDLTNITSRELTGHSNWVFDVDFSPDDALLVSGSADTTIRLWNVETGESITSGLRAHSNWVRSVEFSPTGRRFVSGGVDGLALIWDIETQRPVSGFINIEEQDIRQINYSIDGSQLAIAGNSDAITLWSSRTEIALGERLSDHQEQILATDISPDGSIIASAGGVDADNAIRIWNAENRTLQDVFTSHAQPVTSLAFSTDGALLASGSVDSTVIIWDVATGEIHGTIEMGDAIFSLAFSPTNNLIAIGDNDGVVTLYDISGSPDEWSVMGAPLSGHQDRVVSLDFSGDGNILASGSRDRTARLWDVTTFSQRGEPLTGHTEGVEAIAMHPSQPILATGSRDFTVRLWNTDTGEMIGEALDEHTNWVLSLAFNPEGTILASAGGDTTVILWDTESNRPLGDPLEGHSDWINSVSFSPNGDFLVSGGRDTQLVVWSTNRDAWLDQACEIANRNFNREELRNFFSDETPQTVCTSDE